MPNSLARGWRVASRTSVPATARFRWSWSRIVPEGHVFATEIDDDAVAEIRAAAATAGLENVTVIRAVEASSNLLTSCCGAIFLRDVYHDITKPAETNRSLRDALRPHGRLAIVDFVPSWFLSTFFPVPGMPPERGGHGIAPDIDVPTCSMPACS